MKTKHTKQLFLSILILAALLLFCTGTVYAVDQDNCLMCHQHRGLSYIDENDNLRLLYISESTYQNSPHGLFACTDCHTDINEIPHKKAEKVNCLMKCHLNETIRKDNFSHKEVEKHLAQSVHSPIDSEGNPKPYPEDYPTCKTCHQDPLYRPLSFNKTVRPGVSEKAMHRCLVCHEDKVFVQKFYNHVSSRLQKGRTSREVVALCSRCHEDAGFLKRHGMNNVVHSYSESYHGKAVFFGNELAPDCLDCHATPDTGVHHMYPKDDPRSAVHPDNRIKVCASADCHPAADKNLMKFVSHLNSSPQNHPAEYWVSVFFVLLTVCSFVPIMLAAILDILRKLFPGRTRIEKKVISARPLVDGVELGPDHKIIHHKKGHRYFLHLTLNQRFQHIILTVSFALLALTGLPMKYFYVGWMETLYSMLGGIEIATLIHRGAAIVMAAVFVYHGIYVAYTFCYYYLMPLIKAGKLTLLNIIKAIFVLPMTPNFDDLKHILEVNRYRLYLTNLKPAAPKFTLKEKFGYLAVFWGVPVIGLSGLALWGEEFFTKLFTGEILNFCLIAHSDEALLACIVIFLWHLYNTHLKAENFPMSFSWFSGLKKEEEVAEGHYGYYLGVLEREGEKPDDHFQKAPLKKGFLKTCIHLTFLTVLTAVTGYLCWLIFYTVFGYHVVSRQHIPEKHYLEQPNFLEKNILEGTGDTKFYRGFRIIKESEVSGHYHNIELQVGPDNRSHCIKCHGDFPHGKTKKIRAFLNMHAFFLACQTCHIRPEDADQKFDYKWYNRVTGSILKSSPVLSTDEVDTLNIKLIPGRTGNGIWQRLDDDKTLAFANNFIDDVNSGQLTLDQKQTKIKKIHEQISEQTITCQQCHNAGTPLIDFQKIGYTKTRIKHLYSKDVSSMIKNYGRFVFPSFMKDK